MRLLLDTCVFIWLTSEPSRISDNAAAVLNDADNELMLSHVSVWEICLKAGAGKLTLPDETDRWISDQVAAWNLTELEIDYQSLTGTLRLPDHHRDPFDRLLISQADVHSLSMVSPDPWIAKYTADLVW